MSAVCWMSVVAQAQPAPDPQPVPAPEVVEPSSGKIPAPAEPGDALPPPSVEPPPAPPPAVAEDPTKKAITVNAWARVGARLQGLSDPKKLDHLGLDGVFELHTDGAITDSIGVTANLTASFGGGGSVMNGDAALLDLIGRFDICDPFHIWVGRMLVPSDRANFSGDWFASPWYYAGTFALAGGGPWGGPEEGPNGRNDGVTVWGQFGGGLFKYYLSAFDLQDRNEKPLWSGRLNLSLINPEPGYYHSSTYYGTKDIFAIGIGAQVKKDGSIGGPSMPVDPMSPPVTDDYSELNVDVLFEKNLGGAGVFTAEGAFYKYEGDFNLDYSWLGLVSYLTPDKIGPGKIQPLVRVQQLKPKGSTAAAVPASLRSSDAYTSIEAQIGYVIADYSARLALGFQHTDLQGTAGNALYLGAQFLK